MSLLVSLAVDLFLFVSWLPVSGEIKMHIYAVTVFQTACCEVDHKNNSWFAAVAVAVDCVMMQWVTSCHVIILLAVRAAAESAVRNQIRWRLKTWCAHLRSITRTRAQRGRRGFQSPRRLELNASYTVASISGGQFRDAVDRLKTPLLHKPRPRPTDNPLRRTLTSVQTLSCAHHGRRLFSSPQTPHRDDNVDGEFLLA